MSQTFITHALNFKKAPFMSCLTQLLWCQRLLCGSQTITAAVSKCKRDKLLTSICYRVVLLTVSGSGEFPLLPFYKLMRETVLLLYRTAYRRFLSLEEEASFTDPNPFSTQLVTYRCFGMRPLASYLDAQPTPQCCRRRQKIPPQRFASHVVMTHKGLHYFG